MIETKIHMQPTESDKTGIKVISDYMIFYSVYGQESLKTSWDCFWMMEGTTTHHLH